MEKWQEEAKRRQEPVAEWARRWHVARGMRDGRGPGSYTGDSGYVGPGWIPILERLAADLVALGWDRHLDQVKEKFGALRFYIGAGTEAMWKRIEEAADESIKTCEECGAPAARHRTRKDVVVTLCPACEEKLYPPSSDDADEDLDPRAGIARVIYSGTCLCGHTWNDHHCQIAQDPTVIPILGTSYPPDVCEFYGCNEEAGLDEAGEPHCFGYVDATDPDPARHVGWLERLEAARARMRH